MTTWLEKTEEILTHVENRFADLLAYEDCSLEDYENHLGELGQNTLLHYFPTYRKCLDDPRKAIFMFQSRDRMERDLEVQIVFSILHIVKHMLENKLCKIFAEICLSKNFARNEKLGFWGRYTENYTEHTAGMRILDKSDLLGNLPQDVSVLVDKMYFPEGRFGLEEQNDNSTIDGVVVDILYAGSIHDSDRSTLYLDNSSSIWRPSMDAHWAADLERAQ